MQWKFFHCPKHNKFKWKIGQGNITECRSSPKGFLELRPLGKPLRQQKCCGKKQFEKIDKGVDSFKVARIGNYYSGGKLRWFKLPLMAAERLYKNNKPLKIGTSIIFKHEHFLKFPFFYLFIFFFLLLRSGLGVTCSARDPRFAGSNPAEVYGFFRT